MDHRSMQFGRGQLLAALSVLTFGLTALTAVLGFGALTPVVFILGFFIVVPLVAILGDSLPIVASDSDEEERDRTAANRTDDPVEQLRSRYARGELTGEEFERRLERLLETEDLELTNTDRARERTFERN